MKKISKAIIFEIVPLFFVINFFFIFLMLMEQMVQLAELVFTRSVPFMVIAKIFVYYMPSFLVITVPISVLLAVLLAFSRFSADSELVAMIACGASGRSLSKPVAAFGIAAMLLSMYVSIYLLPKGSSLAVNSLNELVQNLSINDIREKEMYSDLEGIIFYADKKIDNSNFENVIFVYTDKNSVISAKRAVIVPNQSRSLIMKFQYGKFVMSEDHDSYSILDFETLSINFPLNISVAEMPENERLMTLSNLRDNFDKGPEYIFEYHKRFAIPLGNLFMAFIGFSLGIFLKRGGRSSGLVIASLVAVLYNVAYIAFANFTSDFSPILLAWIPNILLGLFTTVIFVRRVKN